MRDPLARLLAGFFQGGERIGVFDPARPASEADIDALSDRFALWASAMFHGHDDWFDGELKPVTGIDVYATPFPVDAGFEIYAHGRFRTLLVRFEDLRSVGPAALGDFLGADHPLAIPDRNVGADKAYAALYSRMRDEVRVPAPLVHEVYNTQCARHFYTESEIAAFRSRWRTVDAPSR